MRKLIDYILAVAIICTILLGIDYYANKRPKFSISECVKDQIQQYTRKILKVDKWIYTYCRIKKTKCLKTRFSMRIKDFDLIMKPTTCPEAK